MFDVKEISLKNMGLYALSYWRTIIITALVFAVLFPVMMFVRGLSKTDHATFTSDDKSEQLSVSAQLESVKAVADAYRQSDQIEELIRQIDTLEISRGTLKSVYLNYYIDLHGEEVPVAASIEPLYSSFINSDKFIEPLIDLVGVNIDPAVYRKYISVSVKNSSLIVLLPCLENTDEENCLLSIDEMIQEQTNDYQSTVKFDLKLVDMGSREDKNAGLMQELNEYDSRKNNLNSTIAGYTKSMTDEQINLARKLANNEMSEDEIKKLLTDQTNENNEANDSSVNSFGYKEIIKYSLSGATIGALIMMAILCSYYILSDRLHSVKELTKRAQIRVLGTIDVPNPRHSNRLDNLIRAYLSSNRRKLRRDQQIEAVLSSVSLVVKQNGLTKVCFISSLFDRYEEGLFKDIAQLFHQKGLDVEFLDDIVYNKNSLLTCADSDGLIFVEQLWRSRLSDIENEIITARGYDISVLGAVVIE